MIENINPESLDKLLELMNRKEPVGCKEYEEHFKKEMPDMLFVYQYKLNMLGFDNVYHAMTYCVYHNSSIEDVTHYEFSSLPQDATY